MQRRLAKGQVGINPLDAACREHDIAYSKNKSLEDRHKADFILENRAWERVKSKDAKLGEKAAAWLVTTGMKVKRKLGMGRKRRSPFASFNRDIVSKIGRTLKPQSTLKKSAAAALKAARFAIRQAGGKKNIRVPRVIPFNTHSGGFLPLIPLFAGLSAIGALSGGAAGIAKTVIDAKNAKKKLEEEQRHNKAMEAIGAKGLYLKKNNKGGFGLYLKKQKNYQ